MKTFLKNLKIKLQVFLKRHSFIFLLVLNNLLVAQSKVPDSTIVLNEAHKILKVLCSTSCFGRGYTHEGLVHSQRYLLNQLKCSVPLFAGSYEQDFTHAVNSFPRNSLYIINGKNYTAGYELIPDPSTASIKGEFKLHSIKKGVWQDTSNLVQIEYKRKLTHSVSTQTVLPYRFYTNDSVLLQKNRLSFTLNHKAEFVSNFKNKNLAGYIRGSQQPDSFIVISAHYDHLGGIGKKTYYPGANDNASGVSMLLNLLHYFKNNPYKKSIAFILFSGEEAGLIGSHYFTEHSPIPLSHISTLINLDLLGTGDDGLMVVNGSVYPELFTRIEKQSESFVHIKSKLKQRGKAANSDHFWFSEKGVKSIFLYTMGGISAYHDPYDKPETLPFTAYFEVFSLLRNVIEDL